MGLFDKLKASFGKGKIQAQQKDELRNIIAESMRDGHISDDEIKEIRSFFASSDLSENDFNNIKNESFLMAAQWAISDRRVSQTEANSLQNIARRLEISDQVWNKVGSDLNLYFTLNEIESGRLPRTHPANVILQKGETGHYSSPAYILEEKVVARRTVGSSRGTSIRIMKGVSYRIGASKGRIENETAMVRVSEGTFAVTNKRLIFSGDKKSFSAEYKKLLDIQLFSDGIQFSLTSRQKPIIVGLHNSKNVEIIATLVSYIINQD